MIGDQEAERPRAGGGGDATACDSSQGYQRVTVIITMASLTFTMLLGGAVAADKAYAQLRGSFDYFDADGEWCLGLTLHLCVFGSACNSLRNSSY